MLYKGYKVWTQHCYVTYEGNFFSQILNENSNKNFLGMLLEQKINDEHKESTTRPKRKITKKKHL